MKPKVKTAEAAMESLRFGANNLGLIIRLYWLPVIFFIGLYIIFLFTFMGGLAVYQVSAGEADPTLTLGWPYHLMSFALTGVSLLLFAPGSVALMRIISGDMERPTGIAYFRFGDRELRFVGASLLLMIIYFAVTMLVPIYFFTSAVVVHDGTPALPTLENYLPWYAVVVVLVAYIWFSVRMVPFLPMTAIENRIAPVASFRLSAWNFWRIFGAYLMLIIIMIMLYIGFAICIAIAAMIVMFVIGGLLASLGGGEGAGIGLGILLGVAFLVVYALVIAFVTGAFTHIQAKIYLDLARPKTEQDLIDKLDDTPRKPEDEPDPEAEKPAQARDTETSSGSEE